MDVANTSIGARLRQLRRDAMLTQEELAERAGVSRDLVAKLEQGTRQSARLISLVRLADALDVGLSELLGKRAHLDGKRDDASVLAIRDVLLSPSLLPGLEPDDAEPTALAELKGAVAAAGRAYWAGKFAELAAALPALIMDARASMAGVGPAAAAPLALAYDLAASLMVHMGKDDLAAISAERAITAAASGDDELLHATLHGTYAWVLLHQGRLAAAEQLAARMAARLEPSFSAPDTHIAAWGNLLMTALAPAAVAGRDVSQYISLAGAGAERIGHRVSLYQTSFGPATVAMQAVHAYTVRREPGLALEAARKIRAGDLQGISYGRHMLDVAQAHVDAGHVKTAIGLLTQARTLAPVWFRHQGIARSLVRELVEHSQRMSPALRTLARSVGIS